MYNDRSNKLYLYKIKDMVMEKLKELLIIIKDFTLVCLMVSFVVLLSWGLGLIFEGVYKYVG